MGLGFGWTMGVFLAIVVIIGIMCAGCFGLAIVGGGLKKQEQKSFR